MSKKIKTFIIEVHGYNDSDIETGLQEAVNRIHDTRYTECINSEVDGDIDGETYDRVRGFKSKTVDGTIGEMKDVYEYFLDED